MEMWGYFYLHSRLKRFDGMENVGECRRGGWRYLRDIGVVNVVIAAVQQIQQFDRNAECVINFTTDLRIEQCRCPWSDKLRRRSNSAGQNRAGANLRKSV